MLATRQTLRSRSSANKSEELDMKTKNERLSASAVLFASTILLFGAPVMAEDLKAELVAMEKAAWQAWADRDGKVYEKFMTKDAVLVVAGAGVTTGRDMVVAGVNSNECEMTSFDFADVKLRQLTPDVVILTYTATQDTVCGGEELPETVYSTSIYVRQDGEWKSTSYQETPLD